jgi:hypothetical protein
MFQASHHHGDLFCARVRADMQVMFRKGQAKLFEENLVHGIAVMLSSVQYEELKIQAPAF